MRNFWGLLLAVVNSIDIEHTHLELSTNSESTSNVLEEEDILPTGSVQSTENLLV